MVNTTTTTKNILQKKEGKNRSRRTYTTSEKKRAKQCYTNSLLNYTLLLQFILFLSGFSVYFLLFFAFISHSANTTHQTYWHYKAHAYRLWITDIFFSFCSFSKMRKFMIFAVHASVFFFPCFYSYPFFKYPIRFDFFFVDPSVLLTNKQIK